jgi:hypothetical protein
MFKQLRDWMVCGSLNDKYDEFFICMDDKKAAELQVLAGQLPHQAMLDSIMGDIDSGASVNDVEELFFGRSLLL